MSENLISAVTPKYNISVNPWYYCNFRCDFCYLTEQQLSDKKLLPLEVLAARLDEVLEYGYVGHIDLYGGEVLLLPESYLRGMLDIFHERSIDDIVLITNLSHVPEIANDKAIELSVSYDFGVREKSDNVYQNMFLLQNPFNILSLAGRKFLDTVTPDEYVEFMNSLPNLKGCEIKPYSSNQANEQPVSFKEYEEFVWAVVDHPDRNFYFENETQIEEAAKGRRNAYSNDHVYITPSGKFAVLEFDLNDREFFLELDDMNAYAEWAAIERERVNDNPICKACPYLGSCLSEHLRDVKTLDDSCNGFRGLIDKWFDT